MLFSPQSQLCGELICLNFKGLGLKIGYNKKRAARTSERFYKILKFQQFSNVPLDQVS